MAREIPHVIQILVIEGSQDSPVVELPATEHLLPLDSFLLTRILHKNLTGVKRKMLANDRRKE